MKPESRIRNHLRATRTRLGLSQQELARAAGVTRQTIGGIEAGLYAPSAAVALRLAKALGCRVEELFWLEEDLPTIHARTVDQQQIGDRVRCTVAQVGGRWIAQPLLGEDAFRTEMIPCDGVGWRCADSPELEVALLDEPQSLGQTVALAGCTPVLSLWARAAERWYPGLRVHWSFANSMAALRRLARGEVHAAGLHLHDPATGEANAPYVRDLSPTLSSAVVLINLGVWEEGLLVRPGNPKGIQRGSDLSGPGVSVVNREAGAGSRLLLEQILQSDGVPGDAVHGFVCPAT
jgi:DNA-binding XRE family transcriptional regulator